MGKLIKTHWSRLILLTSGTYQVAAGIEGIFWPKIFFDFLTKNLDVAVKPVPILPIINIVLGLFALCWEWPLPLLVKLVPSFHASIEARLVIYPLSALAAVIMYQGTNAALYYVVGIAVLFWGFVEGEGVSSEAWGAPIRQRKDNCGPRGEAKIIAPYV